MNCMTCTLDQNHISPNFQRIRSAVATAERDVDGFLIEGFHENGAESGAVDLASDVLPLMRKVVERLPDSKPRMYMVSLGPSVGLAI